MSVGTPASRARSSLDAVRDRSRMTSGDHPARGLTAHDNLISLKDGNLFVDDVNIAPDPVRPDDTIDVLVSVANGEAIGPLPIDPDHCNVASGTAVGYEVQVRVTPSWTDGTTTPKFCIGKALIGVNRETFGPDDGFRFQTPDAGGTYAITVELILPGSGNSKSLEFPIEVRQDAPDPVDPGNGTQACNNDADCPGSKVCRGGQCVEPGDDDPLSGLLDAFLSRPIESVVLFGGLILVVSLIP